MLVTTLIFMLVVVSMLMVRTQHAHADQVDQQSHHCHGNGLFEADRLRVEKAPGSLEHHQQRHHLQHDGAGEAAQHADLAGAEGVARVAGMPPGVGVSKERDAQRGGVRAHVPAVRQQRHRAVIYARGDLHPHHRCCQDDHS